jgi:non-ribosomal peptide synthetase component F
VTHPSPAALEDRPFDDFENACRRHATAVALEIGECSWTYAELQAWSLRLAALLAPRLGHEPHARRVGVLASRSLTACGGSLAVLAAGATLVALNPAHPVRSNASTVLRAGIGILVVGEEGLAQMPGLQALCGESLLFVTPESDWKSSMAAAGACATPFADARQMATPGAWLPPRRAADHESAYIALTWAGTGESQEVAIEHGKFAACLHDFRTIVPTGAQDRVATSQEPNLALAMHDMLNTWCSGATLVVMPERARLAPARFILERRINVWFLQTSFAMLLHEQGLLEPGALPSLRLSLLCGDPLPPAVAAAWAAAAPDSELHIVRGQAETTRELAVHRWDRSRSSEDGRPRAGLTNWACACR